MGTQDDDGITTNGVSSSQHEDDNMLQKARLIWFQATSEFDLEQAERIYQSIFYSNSNSTRSNKRKRLQENENDEKNDRNDCKEIMDPRSIAGERLAMLLLQSGRTKEADDILKQLNYKCRLATHVLNYPSASTSVQHAPKISDKKDNNNNNNNKNTQNNNIVQKTPALQEDPPCRIYDHFLDDTELKVLQNVFSDPQSSYWKDHDYAVEPRPSPYVSYVIPLREDEGKSFGFLRVLIDRIMEQLEHDGWKPNLKQQCTHVEMWAHNRPHATGHQLHFDSDNEGQGAVVRHPLISSILYLSSGDMGGPSIITHQRRVSRQLATKAWLAFPALRRFTAFDGRVLHGVVPGKGFIPVDKKLSGSVSGTNRVTLMLAFWRRLQVRDHGTSNVGAARPFPETKPWAKLLRQPIQPTSNDDDNSNNKKRAVVAKVDPIELDHVYQTIGGSEPWSPRMGMPLYDEIYQGF